MRHQGFAVFTELFFRLIITFCAAIGTLVIIKRKDPFLWVIFLANFYFICITGPMGHPRFRIPVESFWFLQALLGLEFIRDQAKRLFSGKMQRTEDAVKRRNINK